MDSRVAIISRTARLNALPEHLAAMASFSWSTGLRAANVTGLQWSQVDLVGRVAWIHPDQASARRAIPVPLNMFSYQPLQPTGDTCTVMAPRQH
jgi:integrase